MLPSLWLRAPARAEHSGRLLDKQLALPSPVGLSPGVVSFGLLGKIHSALSSLPVSSGHYMELDLQNYPFPSAFIDWLLQITGINPGSIL